MDIINKTVLHIYKHPEDGLVGTVLSTISGTAPSWVFSHKSDILFVFQCFSILIAMAVGLATLYTYHLKWKEMKREKKKKTKSL